MKIPNIIALLALLTAVAACGQPMPYGQYEIHCVDRQGEKYQKSAKSIPLLPNPLELHASFEPIVAARPNSSP